MVLGKGKNPKGSNKITTLVSEFDPEDNEKQKDDESLQIVDEMDQDKENPAGQDKMSNNVLNQSNEASIEQERDQFNETIGYLEETLVGINRNLDESKSRRPSSFVGVNFLINQHRHWHQHQPPRPRSDSHSQTIIYPPFHHYEEIPGTPSEGAAAAAVPNYRHIMLKQHQPEKK